MFKKIIVEDWVKSALYKIGYMKHNFCAKITRECKNKIKFSIKHHQYHFPQIVISILHTQK